MSRSRTDAGSATIWVVTACALIALVAAFAVVRGLAVLARHRAEGAADLAALAAAGAIGTAGDPCGTARRIAVGNGADLSHCETHLDAAGRAGTVVVRVVGEISLPGAGTRQVMASARAARLPAGAATTYPEPTEEGSR